MSRSPLPWSATRQGILTKADTEGIDFNFGNPEAMLKGIEWIAFRRPGLGDLLADGVKIAAARIGKGSEKFALHIKGQELPMHDPRGKTGQGLSFAVSPTGADHVRAPHDTPFQAAGTRCWDGSPRSASWSLSPAGRWGRARRATSSTSTLSGRSTNPWGCATSWPVRCGR